MLSVAHDTDERSLKGNLFSFVSGATSLAEGARGTEYDEPPPPPPPPPDDGFLSFSDLTSSIASSRSEAKSEKSS